MNKSIDHLASRQALKMAQLRKRNFETSFADSSKQETVIKDLVSRFLVPNVDRRRLQRKVELEQKRYNETVKHSLKSTIEGVSKTEVHLKKIEENVAAENKGKLVQRDVSKFLFLS